MAGESEHERQQHTRTDDGSNAVPDNGGWAEWRQFVLAELRRLNTQIEVTTSASLSQSTELLKEIAAIQVCIGRLEVKAGVWGGLAGLIAAGVTLAAFLIRGGP